MALARVIRPRVFLEGTEVQCYKISVQSCIGAPSVATIDLPPVEEFFDRYVESPPNSGNFVQMLGVQPRTLVHIFYTDSEDPDGADRLLFEGEFVRYEYVKEDSARFLRLVARDVSNILSNIYVRYYSDFFTPYGSKMSIFTGQATASNPNTESIRLSLIGSGTGLNAEVMNAIQNDTGGFGIAAALRSIVTKALTVNTFFENFNNRTQIANKIITLADIQSRQLLDTTQLASLIQQNMSNLKESASVWDLYAMLMSLVFYFPVSITSAPYLPQAITNIGSSDKGSQTFNVTAGNTLMSLLIKPYTWWTAPPTFNVIFPSQYKSFTMKRDFLTEPTRIMMSAFGVLESIDQQALQSFAPSQFLFVAPHQLADKFDRDVYDSQFKNVLQSASVRAAEENLNNLRNQRKTVEIQFYSQSTTPSQKISLKSQMSQLDASIQGAQTALQSIIQTVQAQTAINQASQAPRPPSLVSAQLWNRDVLTDVDNVSLASREDIKGIIFGFDYLQQTQVELTKAKAISPLALKDYLSKVADYKLVISQQRNRVSALSLHFCPHLVPGFPVLIVDPVRNFFGELDCVTHTMDANGAFAETEIQVSFVRNDEIEFTDLQRNTPGQIQFPAWINPLYLPSNIGQNVYQTLFPQNRPDLSKPGIKAADSILAYAPTNKVNQIAAANRIRQLYFASKDRERFALAFTRRNIASIDQTFVSVLKGSKYGGNYILNSFSDARFQAVQAYINAARKVKTFAPADMAPTSSTS